MHELILAHMQHMTHAVKSYDNFQRINGLGGGRDMGVGSGGDFTCGIKGLGLPVAGRRAAGFSPCI
jgi:hypothetical protein